MSEKTKKRLFLLSVMPTSRWLKNKWWHRFILVLWGISVIPVLYYSSFVLFDPGFGFKYYDFIAFVLFSYLAIPILYRVVLFVFLGDYKIKKGENE